jgi:hypothetical protein
LGGHADPPVRRSCNITVVSHSLQYHSNKGERVVSEGVLAPNLCAFAAWRELI